MLRDAAREGMRLHIRYDPESYHSLLFWALLLTKTRWDHFLPLSREIEQELLSRMRQLHQIWMVEDRYQPKHYDFDDVLRMRANVTWLRDHHLSIWR